MFFKRQRIDPTNKQGAMPKACKPDQCRNPKTGRCVKKSGPIGRAIAAAATERKNKKQRERRAALKACKPPQVRNPETNRCKKKTRAPARARAKPQPQPQPAAATTYIALGNVKTRQACVRDYETKRVLGEGQFGTVVDACKSDDCRFVLKVQPLIHPRIHGMVTRSFKDEVRVSKIAAGLGISPEIHDAWECGGNGFIVMDKVDGPTLAQALPRMDRNSINAFAFIALDALDKAHKKGVMHRDLHGENIMIASGGGVMFIDWGLEPESHFTPVHDKFLMLTHAFQMLPSQAQNVLETWRPVSK